MMIEIDGRQILTTIEEKVDPGHAAIIVIDMQKDFTSPGGFAASLGLDMKPMATLAKRLHGFLDRARAHGVLIVHVMANYDFPYMSDPMYERLHRLGQKPYCIPGTAGIAFHDGLEPKSGEPLVVKHRFDAFFDTELHILLQSHGIKTVVLTGVADHACVDSTTRHAYFLGYYTVYVDDLTGGASPSVHQMTLDSMNQLFGVTALADEVVSAWANPAAEETVASEQEPETAAPD
jgi:ureidoacrylate peracid hydrolase